MTTSITPAPLRFLWNVWVGLVWIVGMLYSFTDVSAAPDGFFEGFVLLSLVVMMSRQGQP